MTDTLTSPPPGTKATGEIRKTRHEIEQTLPHFTGSETFVRHWTGKVLMTEGVTWLAHAAKAHWLTDFIVSYLTVPAVLKEEFQVWTLKKDKDANGNVVPTKGIIFVTDGNSVIPIARKELWNTDFPLDEIKFYLIKSGATWTLLLPSEY